MAVSVSRFHPSETEVRVLLQRLGRGTHARALRRCFLFERGSGRILELQTAYLDHEFGLASLNTQMAVLADLRFFHSWTATKVSRDSDWVFPEHRAAENEMPLTQREIKDFGRWCQRNAASLVKEGKAAKSNVSRLPDGDVVGTTFRNRRLRNVSLYIQWLVTSLANGGESIEGAPFRAETRRRLVALWFGKQLLPDRKAVPPRSLDQGESQALRTILGDRQTFPETPIGIRDRLIFELLDQGLRAGELLKIQVTDVDDAYKLNIGRTIGIVSIRRRPNDVDDERVREPAVKTRPGEIPIPRRLAAALIDYVTNVRRPTIDSSDCQSETPYLLINHSGKFAGKPLSQRNLNRIVAKLKGCDGIPDTLVPHVLRHTHLTELYDVQRQRGRSDQDIRASLIERGRWAPNSTMPARYTARSLMREAADYVEERDGKLHRG